MNGVVADLNDELLMTNVQIEHLEFKRTLDREFWATKLKAKRRRISRLREDLVQKKAELQEGSIQQKERIELTRQHNKALEVFSKNGKMVFDHSLKVVSFLGSKLSEQHHLHQTKMEDQRLQNALREVESMDQLHQTKMKNTALQDALREVESMDLNGSAGATPTNSTTAADSSSTSGKVPFYLTQP